MDALVPPIGDSNAGLQHIPKHDTKAEGTGTLTMSSSYFELSELGRFLLRHLFHHRDR